jgi:hypothetical protein
MSVVDHSRRFDLAPPSPIVPPTSDMWLHRIRSREVPLSLLRSSIEQPLARCQLRTLERPHRARARSPIEASTSARRPGEHRAAANELAPSRRLTECPSGRAHDNKDDVGAAAGGEQTFRSFRCLQRGRGIRCLQLPMRTCRNPLSVAYGQPSCRRRARTP